MRAVARALAEAERLGWHEVASAIRRGDAEAAQAALRARMAAAEEAEAAKFANLEPIAVLPPPGAEPAETPETTIASPPVPPSAAPRVKGKRGHPEIHDWTAIGGAVRFLLSNYELLGGNPFISKFAMDTLVDKITKWLEEEGKKAPTDWRIRKLARELGPK
jgi:hypothetical protein